MKSEAPRLSGISESRAISRHVVDTAVGLMSRHFEPGSHELYSWGSVGRREMGPYSDLDFVLVSNQPDLQRIAGYKQELSMALSAHYLDILERHSPRELHRIARIDGTDRQALLFMRNEELRGAGIMSGPMADIRQDKPGNLREIFHILANLEFVYPKLFGPQNLKFGPGRMKDFHFAFLLSRLTENSSPVQDIPEALVDLRERGHLSAQQVTQGMEALDVLMYLRNRTQEIDATYHTILKPETYQSLSEVLGIPRHSIHEMLADSAHTVRSMYEQLRGVAVTMARTHTESNASELISKIIEAPQSVGPADVKRIIQSGDEILMMLLAYTTTSPEVLEELRKANPTKWYVLYGIANSPHANEETLMRLMVPESGGKELEDLYTDFAWRNIYLYVAKNPAATSRVRQHILNYPNARPMDIAAAQKI